MNLKILYRALTYIIAPGMLELQIPLVRSKPLCYTEGSKYGERATFAQKQIEGVEDTTLLRRLIVKMSTAQTMQEAILSLVAVDNDAKRN